MKNTVCLLFAFTLSLSAYAQENVKNDINQFIDSWHKAAELNDQDEYFSKIDALGIYIGTDSTEIWTKQEFYDWSTSYFYEEKAWKFAANSRNIYISDDKKMAWFDELINFKNGTLRGSGVLVKRDHGWQIIHYVLSVPVPNDKFKAVMTKINSSSILEKSGQE